MSVAAGLVAARVRRQLPTCPLSKLTSRSNADGTSDAAFIHPASGSHPGVLIWTDAFGLRPSMRDIGKRIASEGYSVLVPNPSIALPRRRCSTTCHF